MKKAEINKNGHLVIERAGVMKEQMCPFDMSMSIICGDWCPHFEEPRVFKINSETKKGLVLLELCHGKELIIEEYKDNREGSL